MQKINVSPKIGWYLSGFTDGEGSFNVVFRQRKDYHQKWKVSLCFNISQKDQVILALFKKHLKCGTLRKRADDIWYFEVNNFEAIKSKVIPFFERFNFLSSKKKRDFSKFREIASIIDRNEHLTVNGIKEILDIRNDMNDGGKRKYSEKEILGHL